MEGTVGLTPSQALRFNFLSSRSVSLSPWTPFLSVIITVFFFHFYLSNSSTKFSLTWFHLVSIFWAGNGKSGYGKGHALIGLIGTNKIPTHLDFWELWRCLTVCILKGFQLFLSHVLFHKAQKCLMRCITQMSKIIWVIGQWILNT